MKLSYTLCTHSIVSYPEADAVQWLLHCLKDIVVTQAHVRWVQWRFLKVPVPCFEQISHCVGHMTVSITVTASDPDCGRRGPQMMQCGI